MLAITARDRPRTRSRAPMVALGVCVVLACGSFESRADVECMTDEDTVVKCEYIHITLKESGRRHTLVNRCVENCAVCGVLTEDEL